MLLLILAAAAAVATARPSYIAVPADQIAFVDLTSLHLRRTPRQTLEPPPPPPPPQPLLQLPRALYQEEYQPIAYAPQGQLQLQQQQTEYQPIPIQQYHQQPIPLGPRQPARIVQAQQDSTNEASALESRPPDFGEYVDFGAHTGDNGAFGWYADYPINNHDSSFRK